jgi:hypothetical protein
MNLVVTRGARYEYTDTDRGKHYFSASQVLNVLDPDAFKDVEYEKLEAAQYRGRRIHHLFAKLLAWRAGLYPVAPTCEPPFRGYLDSLMHLMIAEDLFPLNIEHRDVDPSLPIAGTFDAKVLWGLARTITLTDLKTGKQKRRAHRVQLQIYRRFAINKDVKKMCTIYAQQDGSPAIVEWVTRSAEDEAWMFNGVNVLIGRSYG